VLNEPLCQVQSVLPRVPPGTLTIRARLWRSGSCRTSRASTPSGTTRRSTSCCRPMIDEGYLWVAIADVPATSSTSCPTSTGPSTGSPRPARSRTACATSASPTCLAEQAADPQRVAFTIDDTFGKSQVIVFHTDRPLFPELRPTTESAASFAEDLAEVLAAGRGDRALGDDAATRFARLASLRLCSDSGAHAGTLC
jgi:eukaryotic-like serine/threonine-protein kinase